jgi:hypothetical protein
MKKGNQMAYIVAMTIKGRAMWLHKDGNPTLNQDSAYRFPDRAMAERYADRCAAVEMARVQMVPPMLADMGTRFMLPIVDPMTGESGISAEELYNRACARMGHQIEDHIGDLILDNLDYDATGKLDADQDRALVMAVGFWAARVRQQLATEGRQ